MYHIDNWQDGVGGILVVMFVMFYHQVLLAKLGKHFLQMIQYMLVLKNHIPI